ncbi:hypothetical protein GCM10022384_32990 [Streptomyces marokkonensis]|uniref:Uncharacterized protein n=1 Tax=Streptomyces marokkonensis TaxID=324855 RepID=A0ABP7QEJ4_9ACTN
MTLRLDVTDRAVVFDVVREAVARFRRLDIVVNNAGALFTGMVEEFSEAQARAQRDVNVDAQQAGVGEQRLRQVAADVLEGGLLPGGRLPHRRPGGDLLH